jgi:fucose permease
MLNASATRKALSGFFVSGMLMSLLGAILPAWGWHSKMDFSSVGQCFLSLNLGILSSVKIAFWLIPKRGVGFVLSLACTIAFAALVYLAIIPASTADIWSIAGIYFIGFAAGILNSAVFHAISRIYRHEPAAAVNLSGTLFGFGCLVTTLLIAGAFDVYTVSSILGLLSAIPLFFAIIYARATFPLEPPVRQRTFNQVARDFRNPGAILFSLLLFFQFGNEWSIAGWLSIFLIRRLGVSPVTALELLALYWAALLIGRVASQSLLPRVGHGKLLMASVVAAMSGCITLVITNNLFGAITGILLVGFGFAVIYPLVVEKIGARFPSYHPGFFNGIFSFALTGGMLAPWLLAYVANELGVRGIMLLPMLGTITVFILLLLIWMEAKLTGRGLPKAEDDIL